MKSNLNQIDKLNQWFLKPEIIDCTDIFDAGNLRDFNQINKIIIHHDSIPDAPRAMIMEINEYHKNKGLGPIAYHFWIDKYGYIYQCHKLNEATNHTYGIASESIGICLNGDLDTQTITELQYKSLIKLLVRLTTELGISYNLIYKHSDIRPTVCPGKNVDINLIKKNVFNYHYLNNLIN